jgi:hypothetical protein
MNFGIVVVASSGLDDGSLSRASQQRSAQEIKTVRFKVPRRVAPSITGPHPKAAENSHKFVDKEFWNLPPNIFARGSMRRGEF